MVLPALTPIHTGSAGAMQGVRGACETEKLRIKNQASRDAGRTRNTMSLFRVCSSVRLLRVTLEERKVFLPCLQEMPFADGAAVLEPSCVPAVPMACPCLWSQHGHTAGQ